MTREIVDRVHIWTFVISGLTVAIAGVALTAPFSQASPLRHSCSTSEAVAAIGGGGTSLFGGRGSIVKTLWGVLLLVVINNGMDLQIIDPDWKQIATGVVLIAALGSEYLRRRVAESRATAELKRGSSPPRSLTQPSQSEARNSANEGHRREPHLARARRAARERHNDPLRMRDGGAAAGLGRRVAAGRAEAPREDAGSENTASERPATDVDVVYSSYDREAAFFRGCLSGIEARAEELGVNLTVTLSGYNPTKQIAQIETAIQQQPDALIITPLIPTHSRLRREAIMCGVARWRAFVWRRPDPR